MTLKLLIKIRIYSLVDSSYIFIDSKFIEFVPKSVLELCRNFSLEFFAGICARICAGVCAGILFCNFVPESLPESVLEFSSGILCRSLCWNFALEFCARICAGICAGVCAGILFWDFVSESVPESVPESVLESVLEFCAGMCACACLCAGLLMTVKVYDFKKKFSEIMKNQLENCTEVRKIIFSECDVCFPIFDRRMQY